MSTIFDIRGSHGSGKSHTVRGLLNAYDWGDPIVDASGHLGYHLPEIDCAVLARYTEFGGGCDGVKEGADEVCRRVRLFASQCKIVVFEGILISHTYERYAKLADELGRENYHFLFLNTPLQVCIHRVETRRKKKGNLKPLNPRNVIKDHACDWGKLRPKFKQNGYNVGILDWRCSVKQLLERINNALD
jgi:hypothetical protein